VNLSSYITKGSKEEASKLFWRAENNAVEVKDDICLCTRRT